MGVGRDYSNRIEGQQTRPADIERALEKKFDADQAQARKQRLATLPGLGQAVMAAVCAHHRLLWIRPFVDGNGRTARLHTHLTLTALGLTHGLWSPLRGMARDHETYYTRLNNADLERRNDLDGRGPLSQEELVAFAIWLLDVCLDQAEADVE